MADIVALYIEDKATKPSAATNVYSWLQLKPHFGSLRPDQVTREKCREYTAMRRKKGRSDGTIHRELCVLNAALRWHSKTTPAVVELPQKSPPREYHLTKKEYEKFRDAAEARGAQAPHIYLFILLAYTTAGRAEALLQLTWDRVDFDRGHIKLATGEHRIKGRATVPMKPRLREALEKAKTAAQTDFVIEWGGKPVLSVKKAFARVAEDAKLPNVTPHVLRHTAAVHMAEGRVPMAEIAQYLGHTSTAITEKHYARFSPEYLRNASDSLVD